MNSTVARRALAAFGLATLVALTSGCDNLPFIGDKVAVEDENPALAAEFHRIIESKGTARLGDVIAKGGIPEGSWDRMYSFDSPNNEKELNRALGTSGLDWARLPEDSEQTTQVFVRNGKVVRAFNDQRPRYGVRNGKYATPDSTVRVVEKQRGYPANDVVSVLEIDEFS
ncbi:hypothetical protein ACQPW1_12360 [Nocardia sp. CA-128927]|uniref:hypothetical protein n=1 Tax=Nocardia sp. CA-128927 TaxID=3239975 RepID=UPI003D96DEE7